MNNLVIVAIPHPDDYVWKISSEKIPHMTLLFLGDAATTSNQDKMAEFLEHASQTMLSPFYLDVDDRGVLGDNEADVLYFDDSWDLPEIVNFRSVLLRNDSIKMAYESAEQHPEWRPHLTLGYPEKPAKPDNREYPGINSVRFNRIALWTGDYTGPEFKLKHDKFYGLSEVSMSVGKDAVADFLAHYGVKGMKWGVRNGSSRVPTDVAVKQKGKKLKTDGGKGHAPHEDAVKAASASQKAKASGIHALSNDELQQLVTRKNLEQQAVRLQSGEKKGTRAFLKEVLRDVGKQQVKRAANDVATRKVDKVIKKNQ